MEDKAREIIDHYGLIHQLKYMQTEMFELIEAIMEWRYWERKNVCNIREELSDVLVMLLQIKEYFRLNEEDIKEIMNQKIDRQLKRMEEGK